MGLRALVAYIAIRLAASQNSQLYNFTSLSDGYAKEKAPRIESTKETLRGPGSALQAIPL